MSPVTITKFVDERSQNKVREKVDSEVEGNSEKTEKGNGSSLQIHYLPLKIEFNGKADVDRLFATSIKIDEDTKVMETDFRGRPLKGSQLELPSDYKGIVMDTNSSVLLNNARSKSGLESINDSNNGSSDKVLYVKKEFNDLTYWNWDRVPSGMDKPVKVMDWLQLANQLHNPISQDE